MPPTKLNEKNFRDGEELKIDIELNKPIYLSIFQTTFLSDNCFQFRHQPSQYCQCRFSNVPVLDRNEFIPTLEMSLPVYEQAEEYEKCAYLMKGIRMLEEQKDNETV